MKKLITLFAIAGLVLALAPAAQAEITATGSFDLLRTLPGWCSIGDPSTGDWKVLNFNGSIGAGTLNVAGGNLFDANGHPVSVGWGAGTSTITVTGPGSELRNSNRFVVGNNKSHGDLIVEAGGLVDIQGQLHIGATGLGTALVTGANSKLTTPGTLYLGQQTSGTGILTVEDSGLVQASGLQFGWDPNPNAQSIHMGVGGVLAVSGSHLVNPFQTGGLFNIVGAGNDGEIQYDAGAGWVNMTGATEGSDYTLTYETGGIYTGGYTVLTRLGGGGSTPGTLIYGK
jgi:T5SS/PEP-CTERM-associated repeat protein